MENKYCVCEVNISRKTGLIALLGAKGPFDTKAEAAAKMQSLYKAALKKACLQDGCVDPMGAAIPGGYCTQDEAGIYDYAPFASDQLLELTSFTVVELKEQSA